MSILSKIFSSGATELVKGVGGVIDDLSTSDEERLEAKRKIKEAVLNYEKSMQEQVTTFMFVLISVFSGNIGQFQIESEFIPVYQTLLIVIYTAYFGGRSFEKIKDKRNE